MRTIEASDLAETIEELCLEISTSLPRDVSEALTAFREVEESAAGRQVIDLILENAQVAASLGVPLCQDTGFFTIYITLARDAVVTGDIYAAAAEAVARATRRGSLRASIVEDPMGARTNTGDNTPPLVDIELSTGETSTLGVMAKGGGSEMASKLAMLPPGAGWRGVLDFVVEVVEELGPGACPPLVLGLGVGGSFDRAPRMAKEALMRPLDVESPDPLIRAREEELTREVNRLGIGPGALGGTVTCIGARIMEAPCHMANLPVAVSVCCHSLRRKTVDITG
jgi:fumarate hydratase subunit alpha